VSGLRPVLRLARRDVRRSPGRSLLIVLMVALPVSGAAFIDVVLRTADVRGAEKIPLELGRTADARVAPQLMGNLIVQRPDETYGSPPSLTTRVGDQAPPPSQELPPTDPRPLLPDGARFITDRRGEVPVRTTNGLARAGFRELDITDPMAQGLFTVVDGRAPRAASEVAVTPVLLDTLGQDIGDQLEVTAPATTLRIVGTVRPVSDAQGAQVAVALPDTLLGDLEPGIGYAEAVTLLVDTPQPFSWEQVLDLNAVGVAVFSRAVVENPPARSAIPLYDDPGRSPDGGPALEAVLAVTLVVGLAVAEVALLAGAAFAVGLRRQSRVLGLLAAAGAGRRQVRAVVLGQGLVLGAFGGVVGVVAGTLGGVAAVLIATRSFDRFLLAPDIRPLELSALTLVGIVTGLIAAVLPARTAARQDIVAALSGRRGVVHTRRRFPVIGLITAAVGAALALGGGALALAVQRQDDPSSRMLAVVAVLILAGAVLSQLGLIVATPSIIGAAAKVGRFLPLAPRLALRDAARHRGRTAPAVAAILGAVAGSVALTLFVASLSDKEERQYMPSLADGQALIRSSYGTEPASPAAQLTAISRIAPPDKVIEVQGFPYDRACTTECQTVQVVAPPEKRCPLDAIGNSGVQPSEADFQAAAADERCNRGTYSNTPFSGPVVGDYADYLQLVGEESPAARAAIEAGGMVVFDTMQVVDGRGVVEVSTHDATTGTPGGTRSVRLPAVHVPLDGRGYVSGWLSPAAAAKVGVPVGTDGTIVQYDVPPDDDTEEAITAALVEQGEQGFFRVERGYRDGYGVGLLALLLGSAVITLGAAGVATGLAQADGRADQSTLAAVGAEPRLRRRLTAFQAAVVAGLGALLGTGSGFVPTVAYIYADTELRFVAPWTNLVLIAVVVPAVAAVAAGLLTRSRLPLSRRLAA
jgi:putative ABC transport system permease protein